MKASYIAASSDRVIGRLCLLRLHSVSKHAWQGVVVSSRGVETSPLVVL
jgi:hypothetical protein